MIGWFMLPRIAFGPRQPTLADLAISRSGVRAPRGGLGLSALEQAGIETPVFQGATQNSQGVKSGWPRDYVRRLAFSDTAAIVASVAFAQLVRFGTSPATLKSELSVYSYTLVSGVLVTAWFMALTLVRSREPRAVGTGLDEYRRVVGASTALFGAIAIVSYLLKLEVARGYLAVALPLGLTTLLVGRWLWRKWLSKERLDGRLTSTVLVVGSHRAAAGMAQTFERAQAAGYRVAGVCVPGWGKSKGSSLDIDGHAVPVLGDENAVPHALAKTGADIVAVSNTDYLGPEGMRALAWQLEAVDVGLVVAPSVVDVAGPRLQIHPVAGLPLLHVDRPQYRGAVKVGKLALDGFVATIAFFCLSPLLLVVALLIKWDSRGPILYKAERIGRNGEPFNMLKFRSMVVDAERHRLALVARNQASGPLFKIHADPRVTRVGRWIRRLSVDELPQLINVIRGEMSIVGPRPPLRSEVASYTGDVHRRMLVKPGITGLWQVSGRSDLSWEESVRLDLYYVENWSMIQDLLIMCRTVWAVLKGIGAY
jgi:exopolysaccharide biosynthesis polyprenyl glycosylphosphotransferase